MTAMDRFERELPAGLEGLAAPHTPDYLTDILGQTAVTNQRPAWTFPERWFPMADVASRPAIAPRMPLRLIAVALVILALLISAAVLVGSRQAKLPPLYGPAGNGLVTYAIDGDIYTVDPATGEVKAIVTGIETDEEPFFSPDGTRIAFYREGVNATRWDIVVVGIDGSNLRVITTEPIWSENSIEWAPDSRSLIVASSTGELRRLDAAKTAPAEVIAQVADIGTNQLRPPDADQILYRAPGSVGLPTWGIWAMNADGSDAHLLVQNSTAANTDQDFMAFGWSPDGTHIAFQRAPAEDPDQMRIYVMNADGSDVHPITDAIGRWVETDFMWSPDGRHIAFNRWQETAPGRWQIRPIGIGSLDGGPVLDAGPIPVPAGAVFTYSPDGTTLLSVPADAIGLADAFTSQPVEIDTSTGEGRVLPWSVGSPPNYQRTAFEP